MRRYVTLLVCFLLPATGSGDVSVDLLGDTAVVISSTTQLDNDRRDELERWVRSSAATVALAYGRFPLDRVNVVLRANRRSFWGGDRAVYFGQTTRRGGGQVELYINPEAVIRDYYGDWTATHEFSHLMLPLLDREDRWISEGFATYYQNVLMARSGRYTPEEAWQQLAEGFERGRESRPELSPHEVAAAGMRSGRMKYYWSGAALAMIADMEIRRRSDGSESLDSALAGLQNCCLPARYRWTGFDLFRRLYTFIGDQVFVLLYRKYADKPGFPDVDDYLNGPEYAAIRDEITRQIADLTWDAE